MADQTLDSLLALVKTCHRCKAEKPLAAFTFKRGADSRISKYCLCCRDYFNQSTVRSQEKHAESLRLKRKKKWAERQAAKGKTVRYVMPTPEEQRENERQTTRRYNQLPHRKEYARQWAREHRAKDPEIARQKSRAYDAANREKSRAKSEKWRKNNPAKRCECQMRREARKRQATIGDTREIAKFYEHVHGTDRIRCYWCNRYVPKRDRHVDHIVPLSRQGAHAVLNLCCACSDCNTRKNNKTPEDFCGQFQLPLSPSPKTIRHIEDGRQAVSVG